MTNTICNGKCSCSILLRDGNKQGITTSKQCKLFKQVKIDTDTIAELAVLDLLGSRQKQKQFYMSMSNELHYVVWKGDSFPAHILSIILDMFIGSNKNDKAIEEIRSVIRDHVNHEN